MRRGPLNHIEAREAFHTLLLWRLRSAVPAGTWQIKGGVNLRLFFGSVRYSEDMDIDADVRARDSLKREIAKALKDMEIRQRLAALGIRDVRQEGRAVHKDTDTTLRIKMQIEIQGRVSLPTKVEVSFRPACADDVILIEEADSGIVGKYLEPEQLPLLVPHYTRLSAIRQKLRALALRTQVQARDVFDLFALTNGTTEGLDLQILRRNLANADLAEARNRALDIDEREYSDKVLEFLDDDIRNEWKDRWNEQQVFVAYLAEEILALPSDINPLTCTESLTEARGESENWQ